MTAAAAAAPLTRQQRAFLDIIDRSAPSLPELARSRRFAQWRRVFRASFQDATNGQYDQAMTVIAQRVGDLAVSADKNDAWMPLYIGDYLADTMHLKTAQHGAYLLLLMHQWRKGPIPDDDEILSSITRMTVVDWRKMRASLESFFTVADGTWSQGRVERERARTVDKRSAVSEARSKAGAKGAATKWQKDGNCHSLPSGLPSDLPSKRHGKPMAKNGYPQSQEEEPSLRSGSDASFHSAKSFALPAAECQNSPSGGSFDAPGCRSDDQGSEGKGSGLNGHAPESPAACRCPACPVQRLVEAYHELLPEYPRVVHLSPARAGHIRQRWREWWQRDPFPDADVGLGEFRTFFRVVRTSDFLMGRKSPPKGERPFVPTIDFLFDPEKHTKILEMGYHDA